MVNMISGGLHARGTLAIQDFLVVPLDASYGEALEACVAVHAALGRVLAEREHSTLRADEGGYGPSLDSVTDAFELLELAVARTGREPGPAVAVALDVASTHFYDPTSSLYRLDAGGTAIDAEGLVGLLAGWVSAFPIFSIEDGLAEDDWEGWQMLTAELGAKVQLVGDDLFTTSLPRLERGIELGAANAVLVKMNSDRHIVGNDRREREGAGGGIPVRRLGALGRDRGSRPRRSGRRDGSRPDQDRLDDPVGAACQVQRAPPDRAAAGEPRRVRRAGCPGA